MSFMLAVRDRAVRHATAALVVVFSLLALTAAEAQVDLKQYVALIETNYHQETRDTFRALADHFAAEGQNELAQFFSAYSEGGGFGTGWIYVAPDGENYVITNRHVVSQAESVNVRFEQRDGSFKTYSGAPIVYVDDSMDLAVVQFPGAARVFKAGFPLDVSEKPDGTELFAAGFPGFNAKPLWQFSTGIVTNARARPDVFPGYDYLIQHSAQIDPGNSGGPLLVRNSKSPTGYAVIGVNTWKATQRENTNFSIPAKELPGVIEAARKATSTHADGTALRTELERAGKTLAAELRSANPDMERIHRYISYGLVGRKGWDAFQQILQAADDSQEWEDAFFSDPIETMRDSVYYLFWLSLGKSQRGIEFQSVSPADEEKVGKVDSIRTDFLIGGKTSEISWTWEYGQWRVLDFPLPVVEIQGQEEQAKPQGQEQGQVQEQAQGGAGFLLVGGGFLGGTSNGYGAVYNYAEFPAAQSGHADEGVFAWSGGLSIDVPVAVPFWVEGQVNLTQKGRYYRWDSPPDGSMLNDSWIRERIIYLQVAALAKLRLTLAQGFSVVFGAGPAANLAVKATGEFWDYQDNEWQLPSAWYGDGFLHSFALSAMAEAGLEFGFGTGVFGLGVTGDFHLTGDFDYGVTENSRFVTLLGGLYVKFAIPPVTRP